MRISTNTIYEQGLAAITRNQEQMLKVQQQLASGRRALTPADDPVASARAIEVSQAEAINSQHAVNRIAAQNSLALVENTLGRVSALLQDSHTLAVAAGNGALSNADRASIAGELSSLHDALLGIANSTDGEGRHLFAGYQVNVPPFVQGASGIQYVGDEGQRKVQVDASRQIAVSENGAAVFERPPSGESLFKTIGDLAALLQTPGAPSSGSLGTAMGKLSGALDHVLTIRASVGSQLKELDALDTAGENRAIQYQQTLSQLQDVDYAAAIGNLTRQQAHLEAAQRAYMRVTGLSLFNFF